MQNYKKKILSLFLTIPFILFSADNLLINTRGAVRLADFGVSGQMAGPMTSMVIILLFNLVTTIIILLCRLEHRHS